MSGVNRYSGYGPQHNRGVNSYGAPSGFNAGNAAPRSTSLGGGGYDTFTPSYGVQSYDAGSQTDFLGGLNSQMMKATGGMDVNGMGNQALQANAAAMGQPGAAQQTGQNAGTDQTQPADGQTAQPGAEEQPDVTKMDFSNGKKFATDTKDSFKDFKEPQQDFAALQFLLNIKNDSVKDIRGDQDMDDGTYTQEDVDVAIKLAKDSGNDGLANALSRVRNSLNTIDNVDTDTKGENKAGRDDLEDIAKKINDSGMKMTLTSIVAQLSSDKHLDSVT